MKRRSSGALLLVPFLFLHAGEGPALESAIIFERGVYKEGWERDLFGDLFTPPEALEWNERELFPDEVTLRADADVPRTPRKSPAYRTEKGAPAPVAEEPSPPPAMVVPAAREDIASPSSPPIGPKGSADMGPPVEGNEELRPPPEVADPKKKRQERLEELEKKRKKRAFRDPKITY